MAEFLSFRFMHASLTKRTTRNIVGALVRDRMIQPHKERLYDEAGFLYKEIHSQPLQ